MDAKLLRNRPAYMLDRETARAIWLVRNLSVIHVSQQDLLSQTIETSAASGEEFGNGEN
jgi:hypothetical protein